MAKRKAGVNSIIYELDNDDIEISSEDEGKEPKKGRLEDETLKKSYVNKNIKDINSVEVISLDSSEEVFSENEPSKQTHNGGKTPLESTTVENIEQCLDSDSQEKLESNNENLTTYDEEIVINSPANSDLGVVGCENKTSLISVRFKDSKLARAYKTTIKNFLIKLLISNSEEIKYDGSESDNDLDIWPEDLVNESPNASELDDGLFFVDTKPGDDSQIEIPKYRKNSVVISNTPEKEEGPPIPARRKNTCFNCDGDHQLRECPVPRDNQRIAEKRKAVPKMGRYHVEDDQKYGHLVPGRISASLRSALGLKRYELPLYIYRMRLLGYPPGWLEEARISHSGITMFDSTGNAIQDPEEEDGEMCEPGSKDKFDIKKILDFPGFNVPASSRYIEEAHLYGLPPISEQDSKMFMLQTLAPNAVKAYKRKKLIFFPSSNNNSLQGQAEMELDSGDETVEFPSVPPLPDDEPPPAPPPPPPVSPPPDNHTKKSIKTPDKSNKKDFNKQANVKDSVCDKTKESETSDKKSKEEVNKGISTKEQSTSNLRTADTNVENSVKETSSNKSEGVKEECNKENLLNNDSSKESINSVEIVQIDLSSDVEGQIEDIPIPEDDDLMITIDEDYDSEPQSSGRNSPSLDDLEQKKMLLINALEGNVLGEISINVDSPSKSDDVTEHEIEELLESAVKKLEQKRNDKKEMKNKNESAEVKEVFVDNKYKKDNENKEKEIISIQDEDCKKDIIPTVEMTTEKFEDSKKTASPVPSCSQHDVKTGQVKTTQYGTPVLNVASDYIKLPSEDKFSKDICDVINFENLPNSTGKFKKISSLLKKVKSVVDRIQES